MARVRNLSPGAVKARMEEAIKSGSARGTVEDFKPLDQYARDLLARFNKLKEKGSK